MFTDFHYWLTGYGWAEAFFTGDGKSVRFEFSYLSDPLKDLLTSVLEVSSSSRSEIYVDFFDEPGSHRLGLTRVDDNVKLDIRVFSGTAATSDVSEDCDPKMVVFETVDTIEKTLQVFYTGLLDSRSRHTDAEYLDQWINYPFPNDEFKMLEQVIARRN